MKFADKRKYTLYFDSASMKRVDDLYRQEGFRSKSEFIEKAIDHYCGYLTAENHNDYLPKVVISTIKSTLDAFEIRLSKLLFKTNVELSNLTQVTAATVDTSELNLSRVRANSVRHVQQTHGFISLAEAVKFYEEDK